MEYNEKVSDVELYTFTPISASHSHRPPLRPIDDRDVEKARENRGKDKRISVSIIILTFLGSVCVLFGTLFPEVLRAEINMVPWRSMIQASVKTQGWLIRDRLTIINVGVWKYCYDDQLYDLLEILNPQFTNMGRRRRSTEEEEVSVEKREVAREGDISIRCHDLPKPWKMPYHLGIKLKWVKYLSLIGIAACILAFLTGILVMITRLPYLKLLLLLLCLIGAVSMVAIIGLRLSMKDLTLYYNEAFARSINRILREDYDLDLEAMGINLKSSGMLKLNKGVCVVFIICNCVLMLVATIFAEISRNLT